VEDGNDHHEQPRLRVEVPQPAGHLEPDNGHDGG
jgi:hypothetical protein